MTLFAHKFSIYFLLWITNQRLSTIVHGFFNPCLISRYTSLCIIYIYIHIHISFARDNRENFPQLFKSFTKVNAKEGVALAV